MKKNKLLVANTPEELVDIIGLPRSTVIEWEIEDQLVGHIKSIIKESKLTHAAVAKKAKTSRSRVTGILNNSISDVSTDLLLRILDSLGYKVSITVSKKKVAA